MKLLKKEHPAEEVDAALDRLEELGLLDDTRTVHSMARYMVEFRGYGPRRVQQALRNKRFPSHLVEEAVAGVQVDWRERCLAAARRKNLDLSEIKQRQRLARFLAGRGYPGDVVFSVLDELEREQR